MLTLQHLHHSPILHDIQFTVAPSETLAILGASGSGKSTLLKVIAGLLPIHQGEMVLDGVSLNAIAPERRQIAMMFQDFALLPHLNVWQNVAFPLRLRGQSFKQARPQAEQLLAEVGLSHATERAITQLSGGEQQRVALARALISQPKLLLLDEPFSSLDTALRQQLQQQIRQLTRERQIPTILVTHDPAEACVMAENLALLAQGRVMQMGAPDALLARPASAQVAQLLGCVNVFAQYYIPQQAIRLNDEQGEWCEVISCVPQPLAWRIALKHAKWGELTYFHTEPITASHCQVAIRAEAVVVFAECTI